MKLVPAILISGLLASPLHALEPAEIDAVAKRFTSPSGDEHYEARIELNRLVDQATVPGKGDPQAVTLLLVAAIQAEATPLEAKKYLLRALRRIGTPAAVDALAPLLDAETPLLRDEARSALESIRDPKAVAALEAALGKAGDKPGKLGLTNSLAVQRAASSVPLLAPLLIDPDLEIARAAAAALAKIGGPGPAVMLAKAAASDKVPPALKPDLELASLAAAPDDAQGAMRIYQSTGSDSVKHAAFLILLKTAAESAKPNLIEGALKSESSGLRHAAIAAGIRANLPSLQASLPRNMAQMPKADRLVVLANVDHLKPVAAAEKTALVCLHGDDENERVNALAALGRIATQPAFEAVLQALGAREPRVNQAAGTALASINFAGAETSLVHSLEGDSSPDKILAIKALLYRQVTGANALLIKIITGPDEPAAKEAMKTIYFTAAIDDLRALCAAAVTAQDPAFKRSLGGICAKIATRLDTDEARELVKPLK